MNFFFERERGLICPGGEEVWKGGGRETSEMKEGLFGVWRTDGITFSFFFFVSTEKSRSGLVLAVGREKKAISDLIPNGGLVRQSIERLRCFGVQARAGT